MAAPWNFCPRIFDKKSSLKVESIRLPVELNFMHAANKPQHEHSWDQLNDMKLQYFRLEQFPSALGIITPIFCN
jgi:hypothetical protein